MISMDSEPSPNESIECQSGRENGVISCATARVPLSRSRVCLLILGLCAGWLGVSTIGVAATAGDLSPRTVLEQAKQFESAKNYQDAIAAYRRYLAQKPEDDDVRATVAKILSWQEQYDEAVGLYRDILTRHPLDHENRIGLARVLSWQKHFVESHEQYELVLRDEPEQVEALAGLANVLLWSGHSDQSVTYYERAFSITGDAEIAARLRSLKADLAAASASRPSPPASSEPIQPVQSSTSIESEVARLLEQGQRREAERRYPEAVAAYREALALRPEDDEIRTRLARVLSWHGEQEEAVALYRDVLARHPDDQDTRVVLARVLSWQHRFDEARELYGQTLQADPKHLEARRGLAEVAHWQGNRADALARYEALVAETRDPESERRLQAVRSELLVSPLARVGQGLPGLRLPYRDYAKLGYGHYTYTRGQPNERDLLFEIAKPIGNQTLILRVEPINRFGFHDTPVSAEFYSPLWQRAWGYVAAQGTVNPNFAPNYSLVGEMAQGLGVLHSSLAPFEVSFGYRRLNYKSDHIDLLTPGLTIFLPFNLWLTEKLYVVPNTGAMTLSSQLTWRPTDRLQFFASGSFGTSGERIVAAQDFTRVSSRTIQGGVTFPINDRFSVEAAGYYEDRGFLYVRRGGNLSLIYHW